MKSMAIKQNQIGSQYKNLAVFGSAKAVKLRKKGL
jgi:hypothetical protein